MGEWCRGVVVVERRRRRIEDGGGGDSGGGEEVVWLWCRMGVAIIRGRNVREVEEGWVGEWRRGVVLGVRDLRRGTKKV